MLDLSAGAEARARSGSNVDAEQWRHSVTGATRFKVHGDVKKYTPCGFSLDPILSIAWSDGAASMTVGDDGDEIRC